MIGQSKELPQFVESILTCLESTISATKIDKLIDFSKIIHETNSISCVIAIGKFASSMAAQFLIQTKLKIPVYVFQAKGYPIVKSQEFEKLFLLDHPLPNEETILASEYLLNKLNRIRIKQIYFLVSGGGSAVFSHPEDGIDVRTYQKIVKLAMNEGLSITELNQVRSVIDQMKGGKLQFIFPEVKFTNFIISDVPSDNLKVIASGPTYPGLILEPAIIHWLKQTSSILKIEAVIEQLIEKYNNFVKKGKEVEKFTLHDVLIEHQAFAQNLNRELNKINISTTLSTMDLTMPLISIPRELSQDLSMLKPKSAKIYIGEPRVDNMKVDISHDEGGRISALVLLMGEQLNKFPNFFFFGYATDGQDGSSKDDFYFINQLTYNKLGIENPMKIINSRISGRILREGGLSKKISKPNSNFSDIFFIINNSEPFFEIE